jgi:serine phosphatase RsbU (regulator of sigma subunit)
MQVRRRTVLKPHDFLFILMECGNPRGEQFGEVRVPAAIEPRPEDRAAVTLSGIMTKLDKFVGSAMHDDITCLVIKRNS